MKRLVTVLSASLIVLSISGCGQKVVAVPQKCRPPVPEKPVLDKRPCRDILSSSKQCLNNYIKMKAYAVKLESANKVCQ